MNALKKKAETYCNDNGLRFTAQRAEVLNIISASQQPLGAYDILNAFSKKFKNPKAVTIYRALDFLQEHGFVHKIESLNAFVSCEAGHSHRGSQFLICDDCGHVQEMHICTLPDTLSEKLEGRDFALSHWNVEIFGKCASCQS